MTKQAVFEEIEKHLEAKANHVRFQVSKIPAYLRRPSPATRIRISYKHENLWPHSTIEALKAWNSRGASVISSVGNAQQLVLAEHRLKLAEAGVHVVNNQGECSCGLTVEAERYDRKPVDEATIREIVLATPGHFDHLTRSFTDLFIDGRLGPSTKSGYWITEPGELYTSYWHCVYCGNLGHAVPIAGNPDRFEPYHNAEAHEANFAALNVNRKKWQQMKQSELEFWAAQIIQNDQTEGKN